jgi:hypothetical protein
VCFVPTVTKLSVACVFRAPLHPRSHVPGTHTDVVYSGWPCDGSSTRAKKIQELWGTAQINDNMIGDKYLLGNTQLTLADLTCYPGTINMEFILPRVFGWPQDLFTTQVPKLAKWWAHLTSLPVFAAMRQSILDTWISAWDAGNFTLPRKQKIQRINGPFGPMGDDLWLFWTIKSPHRRESKREDTSPDNVRYRWTVRMFWSTRVSRRR